MKIIALLLCLIGASAMASPLGEIDAVGVHLVSRHAPDPGVNNVNLGAYVRTSQGWTAGTYWNTYNRPTVYAGWTTPEWYRLSATVAVGTGYEKHQAPQLERGLSLLVAPTVRLFSIQQTDFKLVYVPKINHDNLEVYHLIAERSF